MILIYFSWYVDSMKVEWSLQRENKEEKLLKLLIYI